MQDPELDASQRPALSRLASARAIHRVMQGIVRRKRREQPRRLPDKATEAAPP
jgi:hypothetical protein